MSERIIRYGTELSDEAIDAADLYQLDAQLNEVIDTQEPQGEQE